MLSWEAPPAAPPALESGELLLFCCEPWAPPPLGPPVLGIGIPTVGKPPGRFTPAEAVGPPL
jgi:hypothetical protein